MADMESQAGAHPETTNLSPYLKSNVQRQGAPATADPLYEDISLVSGLVYLYAHQMRRN